MSFEDGTLSPTLLDDYLDRTVRLPAVDVPPEARRAFEFGGEEQANEPGDVVFEEEERTATVAPAKLAALMAESALTPPPLPLPASDPAWPSVPRTMTQRMPRPDTQTFVPVDVEVDVSLAVRAFTRPRMRGAVIGIWSVALVLLAMLVFLVR